MNIPVWYWLLMVVAVIAFFYVSQTKFRDKMICTFRRPSGQKIEKWVPVDAQYVVFDRGKYGIGRYHIDPKRVTHLWYDRGLNKIFPTMVPSLDFRFNSTEPIDPYTGLSTWLTPEAQEASWQEHSHLLYTKGVAMQGGKKEKFPAGVLALMCIVLICGLIFYTYQTNKAFTKDLNDIVNGMNQQNISNTVPPHTTAPVK